MKIRSLLLVFLLAPAALFAAAKNCGCACCKGKDVCCCHADSTDAVANADSEPAPGFHRLTGIVTSLMPERQAIMVRHDEIPGFMRAMTMLFLVEPAVLEQVKKGDAIKAHMGRDENNKWILRHVEVVTAAK